MVFGFILCVESGVWRELGAVGGLTRFLDERRLWYFACARSCRRGRSLDFARDDKVWEEAGFGADFRT